MSQIPSSQCSLPCFIHNTMWNCVWTWTWSPSFQLLPRTDPWKWEIMTLESMTFKALQLFILVTRKISLFIPPPAVLRVFDSAYWSGITVFKMVAGVMEDWLCTGFWRGSVKYFMSPLWYFLSVKAPYPFPTVTGALVCCVIWSIRVSSLYRKANNL